MSDRLSANELADKLRQRVVDLIYSGPRQTVESALCFPAVAWPIAWLEETIQAAVEAEREALRQNRGASK